MKYGMLEFKKTPGYTFCVATEVHRKCLRLPITGKWVRVWIEGVGERRIFRVRGGYKYQ